MMTAETAEVQARVRGKILVVMDESKEILKQGIRLAQDEKARVTVLMVMPHSHDTCSIGWSEGVQVKTRVTAGDRTDRIVEVAHEEKCDLIVMGTNKRKGILTRIFGDATVKKVIDRVGCPVYVVGSSCGPMPETERSEKHEVEAYA